MMQATDPPAVTVTAAVAKPADVVVVSRDTRNEVLASRDTPLPLIRAHKTEDALLRQAIFLTSTLSVVRPAAGAGEETLHWTYEPYLQRQLCFTSITGQFSCAAAEVEELTEKAAGEAPLAPPGQATPGPNLAAETARIAVVAALHTRAAALFEADRRLKLSPMLKAAGVSIRRIVDSAGSARR
ncbi:MAG: hypothetical protein ACHP9T_00045 [Caulobacterales bacterium]